MIVSQAWLTGHLDAIGTHSPKDYPKKPADLLRKKNEPSKQMTLKAWQALASNVLGKPVRLEVPTEDEVRQYG